jgi:hypothetical protein
MPLLTLDKQWLSSANLTSMAMIVGTKKSDADIRVALIIEQGRLKPVWFEEINNPRDRIFIKQICSKWTHMEGTAKIINFAVWDGSNTYCLSLNTRDFTWQFGIKEEYPFPYQPYSAKK